MLKIKKTIYVGFFMLLGVFCAYILHALAEIWYLGLLVFNHKKYSLGLSWVEWYLVNNILSLLFIILGASVGYLEGTFWWNILYEKRRKRRGTVHN